MKQKKNKAFTLIELLAVIVILAIIALIAVPVIMNIINKANKSAFKDTAYGILSAGELYFAEQQLDVNGMKEDKTIDLSTSTELQLKGEVPEGEILITKDGKTAIAVQNGRYCITKGVDDKDITVTDNYTTCELPKEKEEATLPITWAAGTDYSNLVQATDSEGNVFAYKISDYAESIDTLDGAQASVEMGDEKASTLITQSSGRLTRLSTNIYTIISMIYVCESENCEYENIIFPEPGTYLSAEMIGLISFEIGYDLEPTIVITENSIKWNGFDTGLECVQFGDEGNVINYLCKVSDEIPSTNETAYTEIIFANMNGETTTWDARGSISDDGTYIELFMGAIVILDDNNSWNDNVDANMTKGVWFMRQKQSDGTIAFTSELQFDKNIQ